MFTYTGKMRSRYVTSASTITLETLDGEPVTMPSPFVISNGYITFTVTSAGRYRVRVITPNSHYSYQIEVTDTAQVVPSLTPQAVVVTTGDESRPVGSDIVMWIGGTTQPVNMQNNDIWFKTVASDTTAPSVPTGLTSSAISDNGFTLSWTPSSDNVGVVGYDVLLDSVVSASVSDTTASLSGLTPETTYSVTVRAKDAAGNLSGPSTPLSVATVAVAGTPQHSIWGAEPYPYTLTKETDQPITVANTFYSYGTSPDVSTWRVVGAKVWIPAGATTTGPLAVKAWGAGVPITDPATATASIASLTAGQWNTVYFETPIETNAADTIKVGYRYPNGDYFGAPSPGPDFIGALDGSPIVLASDIEDRGLWAYDAGGFNITTSVYGIDVIYDEGAA